jgi:hypothetical protein
LAAVFRNSGAMLAGLLFSTHEAEDRASSLAATLPFGGMTLIEYQARLLQLAGASQIVVVVGRLTPELLGAVARIGRRGCTVDAVRTAAEAEAKVHPLSRIIMLADGLVTHADIIERMAQGEGDAMLVLEPGASPGRLERVGDGLVWAGVARLLPARLAEVAAMPRDYDVQSALLRTIAQAGGERIVLDPDEAAGHGIQRELTGLETLGRTLVERRLERRRGWFDRWISGPLLRPALMLLMRRRIATLPLVAGVAAAGLGGLLALWTGQVSLGLVAVLLAVLAARGAEALADLRDEPVLGSGLGAAVLGLPALAMLLLGQAVDDASAGDAGLLAAVALCAVAGLNEQAVRGRERAVWDGGPAGLLLIVTLATLVGMPLAGLMLAAICGAVTLGGTIERLRHADLAAF